MEAATHLSAGTLTDRIRAYYRYKTQWVPGSTHREQIRRPSGLGKFCPRREVLAYFFPEAFPRIFRPEDQLNMDLGTAWHTYLQEKVLGPMGILVGTWTCAACKAAREGVMPDLPCECSECATRCSWPGGFYTMGRDCRACRRWGRWKYREPEIYIPELGVHGHADGIGILDSGDPWLVEIKTTAEPRLEGPLPEHRVQANFYAHYLGLKRIIYLYWVKARRWDWPVEFREDSDPAVPERVLALVREFDTKWPTKELPARPCESRSDPRAGYCPMISVCFAKDIEERVNAFRRALGFIP